MSIAEGLTSTGDTAELGQEGPQAEDDQSSPETEVGICQTSENKMASAMTRSPETYLHHKHSDKMQGERLSKASFRSWPERTD